jgi:GNAT superfamily N-acetyltransferase
MPLLELLPSDPYPPIAHARGLATLDPSVLRQDRPDCHLLALDEFGTVIARSSCWWTRVAPLNGQRTGAIGHYAASTREAGSALLSQAAAKLAEAGCTQAVGPMDGNTWRTYRVVTDKGTEPPFFLEPWTPDGWLEHWTGAGFEPIARFTSALATDLDVVDPRIERAAARLTAEGILVRPLDVSAIERELCRIFVLSLDSFKRNLLYAPIAQDEFLDRYRRLLPAVRPELVLLAERTGPGEPLCGFLFAVPDLLQASRGGSTDTVIIKTVAVSPGERAAGLGSVLVARLHRTARDLGFRRAIHALMIDTNVSGNISRRYASPIRRYALLGKRLGA